MIEDLVRRNRSCRRFHEEAVVDERTLRELVDLARLSASGANRQPLKYIISNSREVNSRIFECLKWAGYLTDWPGPDEGERPSAYVVILGDRSISTNYFVDHGIAAQSILLGATERGLGGCMIASVDHKMMRGYLDLSEEFDILLVIALGEPKERVVLEEIGPDGGIEYWRDEDGVHHVPKREQSEIIISARIEGS